VRIPVLTVTKMIFSQNSIFLKSKLFLKEGQFLMIITIQLHPNPVEIELIKAIIQKQFCGFRSINLIYIKFILSNIKGKIRRPIDPIDIEQSTGTNHGIILQPDN